MQCLSGRIKQLNCKKSHVSNAGHPARATANLICRCRSMLVSEQLCNTSSHSDFTDAMQGCLYVASVSDIA